MSTKTKKSKKGAKKAAPKKKLSRSEVLKRNRSKRLKKEADHRRYLQKKRAAAKPAKSTPKYRSAKELIIIPANKKAEIGLNGKVVDHKKNMTMLGNVAEDMAAQNHDEVNHPSHYTTGKIEVIDFIEDQKLDMHTGNAVKYVARAGKKDPSKEITDLEKAVWYLNRKIANLKKAKAAEATKKLDIRSHSTK